MQVNNNPSADVMQQDWDVALIKLVDFAKTLPDNVEGKIARDDLQKIIEYLQDPAANILNAIRLKADKSAKIYVAAFAKKNTGLARSFSVAYDSKNGGFTIDIWLKAKVSDLDLLGKNITFKQRENVFKGASSKYSQLLSVELSKNKDPIVKLSDGQLVRMINFDQYQNLDHASRQNLLDKYNQIATNKNNLQNCLAEFGICLPATLLPAGNKGLVSIKTSHAVELYSFDFATQDPKLELLPKFYAQIIQKLAKLHEMGIVHGDIKPENILIYKNAKGEYEAFLTDVDTLGFEKQLHDYQGTPGYHLPAQSLGFMGYELQAHSLPTEIRKAVTYSTKSDIYALAVLIRDMNEKVDFAEESKTLAFVYETIVKYLNQANRSYVRLPDAINYSRDDLSLQNMYYDMFKKNLKITSEQNDKSQLYAAVTCVSGERNNFPQAVHELLGFSGLQKLIDSIKSTEIAWQQKNTSELQPLSIVSDLIKSLRANSSNLQANVGKIVDEDGLFSLRFTKAYNDLLVGDVHDEARLRFYQEEILLILQVTSLLIMQAQLYNNALSKSRSFKDDSLINIKDLIEIESVFENAYGNLEMVIEKQNKMLKESSIPLLLSTNAHEHLNTLIIDPEISRVEKFAQINKLEVDSKLSLTNLSVEAAENYAIGLTLCGDPFLNISMAWFRALKNQQQMKDVINYTHNHYMTILNLASSLRKDESKLGLSEISAPEKKIISRRVELAAGLNHANYRVQDKLDCMRKILKQQNKLDPKAVALEI